MEGITMKFWRSVSKIEVLLTTFVGQRGLDIVRVFMDKRMIRK